MVDGGMLYDVSCCVGICYVGDCCVGNVVSGGAILLDDVV